jgi:hypothetical protein
MAKTSQELTAQAQKLLEQARKIKEKEFMKVGEIVIQLYNEKNIKYPTLLFKIEAILNPKIK